MKRKEVLTENPLAIALMGALVGMGLEKEKAKKAAAQAVNDAQTGAWKDPDKQPAAAPAPQGADYNQIMKRGSRGEGVKQLQRNLGMTGAEVDGIFGPDTQDAVELFQRNSGLVVDAIFGPNCIAALKRLGEKVEQSSVAVVQEKEKIISKMRSNDKKDGDKNIINQPADVTKKGKGTGEVKSEAVVQNVVAAYRSMYEKKNEAHFPEATAWFKGQWVEVDYKGMGRYYPGKIARIHGNLRLGQEENLAFDIRYPWGQILEKNVPECRVRWMPPKTNFSEGVPIVVNAAFTHGDKCE